jgi:hypothetical protein
MRRVFIRPALSMWQHAARRSAVLVLGCASFAAFAFDTSPAAPFVATQCARVQKRFVIRFDSSVASRTVTLNSRADLLIFHGTAAKDLKFTMPLSQFQFSAPAAPAHRILTAVYADNSAFEFGLVDDACWSRLRRYGAGSMNISGS